MATRYRIGQLAGAADVPASTVRYYERRGLLKPSGRSPHGYRQYDEAGLDRLRFIRAAQRCGFSLDEIESLLELRKNPADAHESVREMIGERLTELDEQIADLQQSRRLMDQSLRRCENSGTNAPCPVLLGIDSSV